MQKQMEKTLNKWQKLVITKIWESKLVKIVSEKDKVADKKINQELVVHDGFKKYEKKTTNFEAVNGRNVVNKAYLDEKILKIDGHISILAKFTMNLK